MCLAAATLTLPRFCPILPPLLHNSYKDFEAELCLLPCSSTVFTLLFLLHYSYHNHQNLSLNGTLSLLSPHKELLCGPLVIYLLCWQIFVLVEQLISAFPSSHLLSEDNELWEIIGKMPTQTVQVIWGKLKSLKSNLLLLGCFHFTWETIPSERYLTGL